MKQKALTSSMWLKKFLLLLAVILFPWLAIPIALYYLWKGRVVKGFFVRCAKALKGLLREGGLSKDQNKFMCPNPKDSAPYLILPRTLGIQYVYAIEVSDVPERLAEYCGDLTRITTNTVRGRAVISIVISDRIRYVRIYVVSRLLLGLSGSVEKEVQEFALRISDSLRSRSPTSKVRMCTSKDVIKNPILEG